MKCPLCDEEIDTSDGIYKLEGESEWTALVDHLDAKHEQYVSTPDLEEPMCVCGEKHDTVLEFAEHLKSVDLEQHFAIGLLARL